MKKRFIVIVVFVSFLACKTTRVSTPATDTTGKAASDTALQGDRMKSPVKQP